MLKNVQVSGFFKDKINVTVFNISLVLLSSSKGLPMQYELTQINAAFQISLSTFKDDDSCLGTSPLK